MKKIFDKLDKLEKKIESKEKASKKILVFIAEKLNNGAFKFLMMLSNFWPIVLHRMCVSWKAL